MLEGRHKEFTGHLFIFRHTKKRKPEPPALLENSVYEEISRFEKCTLPFIQTFGLMQIPL